MKSILLVLKVLLGLIFPLIVAGRAWRRGHREWGVGTALAVAISWITAIALFPEEGSIWESFFGILLFLSSPLIAIAAYRKSMKPVAPPIDCPECSWYADAKGRVTLDQETGEEVSTKLAGIILLISGLGLCLWMVIGALTWDVPLPLPTGGMFPIFILGGFMVAKGFEILTQRPASTVEKIMYKCDTCELEWTE